ncbi:alpha tubulin suppressor [Kickxella alabastrina]|uniref:Alpha tubulin suppressor n=1 Tax=Kickxella alabastrina TaxID=61397 RepID=A0ACC1IFB1_9FUNG|nr:alpha tubulin suppressor [Kickxella alabastrina]
MAHILAIGSNSSGQLATNDSNDAHHLAQTIFADADGYVADADTVWRVLGGGNHAFAWSDDGTKLVASGSNSDGELATGGEGTGPIFSWTPVGFPGDRVRQIACGWNHSVLLNTQGQLFSAGSNIFGQLGTGIQGRSQKFPSTWMPVLAAQDNDKSTKKFVNIACGLRHTLALDENGMVYGWGANRCGQLGIASPDKKSANVLQMKLVSAGLPPIAMLACGRSHSILVANDRRTVFVGGQDKYCQCGPSDSQPVAGTWRKFLLPRPAAKLCSGWEFGAVLLEPVSKINLAGKGGVVAMWGRADHGQLATVQQSAQSTCSRELVYVDLDCVHDIVCGSNHTVSMTEDGAVYMWGWNEHGNAGDPSLKNVHQPLRIDSPPLDTPAVAIGCGYGNSYIIL